MSNRTAVVLAVAVLFSTMMLPAQPVSANGGPFRVTYPEGDASAKAVPARLQQDLRPGRETRLRVVKEHLTIAVVPDLDQVLSKTLPPFADVTAEYYIENPTSSPIELDFGFPVLGAGGGDWRQPSVTVNGRSIDCQVLAGPLIYGIIRDQAHKTIESRTQRDSKLLELMAGVRRAKEAQAGPARERLARYLTDVKKWRKQDAALMVEYAGLDFGGVRYQGAGFTLAKGLTGVDKLMGENLGPLAAIGQQKATQFFGQLAKCVDPKSQATYDSVFEAWGGDIGERSVDLETGKVRPREYSISGTPALSEPDPTVYARIDYLDSNAKLSPAEKEACKSILKNLPVVFTFSPMALLRYHVKFPAKSTQTVKVTYRQHMYPDTRRPKSYQIAYVVHPASFWKSFGPIYLDATAPKGVNVRASVPFSKTRSSERSISVHLQRISAAYDVHWTTLRKKTGQLFVAVDSDDWQAFEKQSEKRLIERSGSRQSVQSR